MVNITTKFKKIGYIFIFTQKRLYKRIVKKINLKKSKIRKNIIKKEIKSMKN